MTSGGTSRSIAEKLDPRDNALNLLRLLLAGLVIVSHAWPLGGFGGDPRIGDLKLGTFAVGGFFAISGYLITSSRDRTALSTFAMRRALRIVPGLWVCVVVTAFCVAGLVGLTHGGWDLSGAVTFVATKGVLLESHQMVGTTLTPAPFPDAWNAPLWTIRYELLAYLAVGVLGGMGAWWRRPAPAVVLLGVASVASGLVGDFDGTAGSRTAALAPFFLAGVVVLRYSSRLPLTGRGAAAAVAALVVVLSVGYGQELAPLPLAYLLIWAAAAAPGPLRRIGATHDLSYGVYLYGWPVAQLLVLAGAPAAGLWAFTAACLLAVIPIAAASWFLVERPAMRTSARRQRVAPPTTVPAVSSP